MTPLFGRTRTCLKARHALITADGHVPSALPGLEKVRLVTHITPAMGAGFAQLSLTFEEAGGVARFPAGLNEAVLYVAAGVVRCQVGGATEQLKAGGFAYIAQDDTLELSYAGTSAHVTIFQKKYVPAPGLKSPASFFGVSAKFRASPFSAIPRRCSRCFSPTIPRSTWRSIYSPISRARRCPLWRRT